MAEWKEVEKNIVKEINFLNNNLLLSPYRQNDPIKCNDCLFRNIATMVVAGNLRLTKIIFQNNNILGICDTRVEKFSNKSHGAHWHNTKIKQIHKYFISHNLKTKNEPNLHFGRADLGVPKLNLFIEIGTINLYKLYCNVLCLKNCSILVVPSDKYALEFKL